ncbi:hypothetical protein EIN_327960 [Entamoeba invadens IP1]|uniref:Leucine rich repeat containing protein BspA family protein n=1 Tax=Entamoeba invadens IP1 TaxID=370355 RepID=A0A0A1TXP3_ENTIV|nr:hypothetical protein EIN_327960 [Entamoeba invadens IP1]ELP86139.1 hypothetical protein EIN_327960 [Entamoeba invadens IP1]|eukprot:XP_004185485.1 hypothetical protein EIN_327960 [Entamoeba invadens IP1]
MSKQLEEFFLMNVVLYLDTFNTLTSFSCVNTKCVNVLKRMQINPLISDKFQCYTIKNPTNGFSCYISRIKKFFPNIKTLLLPSYQCLVPKISLSNFSYIKVKSLNEQSWTLIHKDDSEQFHKTNICFYNISNYTINKKSYFSLQNEIIKKMKTLAVYSKETATLFISKCELCESCEEISIYENDDLKEMWDILVQNKHVLWSLKNLTKIRVFSNDNLHMEKLLIFTEGAPTIVFCFYLNNEEFDMTNLEMYQKLCKCANVVIQTINNFSAFLDKSSTSDYKVSFRNMKKSVEIDSTQIEKLTLFSSKYALFFDEVVINNTELFNTQHVDVSEIECKDVVIHNKTKENVIIKISKETDKVICDPTENVSLCCVENSDILIEQTFVTRYLDTWHDFDFFFDDATNEYDSDFLEEVANQMVILSFGYYNSVTTKVLEVTETPKPIPKVMEFSRLKYLKLKWTTYFLNYNLECLEQLELASIGGYIKSYKQFDLSRFHLKDLHLDNCYYINFDLPSTLTGLTVSHSCSLQLNGTNKIHLKSLVLDHILGISKKCDSAIKGKNIVVDYPICYKEKLDNTEEFNIDSYVDTFEYREVHIDIAFWNHDLLIKTTVWNELWNKQFNNITTSPHYVNRREYKEYKDNENSTCNAVFILDDRTFQGNAYFDFDRMGGICEIGDFCFKDHTIRTPTQLTLPNGLTKIGFGAFQNLTSISVIKLPETINSLPYKCFANLIALTEIATPNEYIEIDDFALWRCKNLTNYPKFVVSKHSCYIDKYLIKLCKLKNIKVPHVVDSIPGRCYAGCDTLVSVEFDLSVSCIGMGAFVGCTNLSRINLNENVTLDKHLVFANLVSLCEIELPPTLQKIRNFMFKNCVRLESVKMHEGITKFGDSAFERCVVLKAIHIPKTVQKIGISCFKECYCLSEIHCSNTLKMLPTSLRRIENSVSVLRFN